MIYCENCKFCVCTFGDHYRCDTKPLLIPTPIRLDVVAANPMERNKNNDCPFFEKTENKAIDNDEL
jgi:hypothetical protein